MSKLFILDRNVEKITLHLTGQVGRVFTNGLGDQGSILG